MVKFQKHDAVVFRFDPMMDFGKGGWVATCQCHITFNNRTRTACILSWVSHTIEAGGV